MKSFLLWAEKYLKEHKRMRRWYRFMCVAAAVVVFATTYMLILPAITLEKKRNLWKRRTYTYRVVLSDSSGDETAV